MEEKMIRLTLKYKKEKGNTTTTIEEDAIVKLNNTTTLSKIAEFEKQAKAIYKKAMKAITCDHYRTTVTLSITYWDGVAAENLKNANRWVSNPMDDANEDHIVLYAQADNDSWLDDVVFLKKDVITSISNVDR